MNMVNAIIYASAMKHPNQWVVGEMRNLIKDEILATAITF